VYLRCHKEGRGEGRGSGRRGRGTTIWIRGRRSWCVCGGGPEPLVYGRAGREGKSITMSCVYIKPFRYASHARRGWPTSAYHFAFRIKSSIPSSVAAYSSSANTQRSIASTYRSTSCSSSEQIPTARTTVPKAPTLPSARAFEAN